jgi:hypothetical protein
MLRTSCNLITHISFSWFMGYNAGEDWKSGTVTYFRFTPLQWPDRRPLRHSGTIMKYLSLVITDISTFYQLVAGMLFQGFGMGTVVDTMQSSL